MKARKRLEPVQTSKKQCLQFDQEDKAEISEDKNNTRNYEISKSLSRDDDESRSSVEKLIDNGNVITDKTSMAELSNTLFINYPNQFDFYPKHT